MDGLIFLLIIVVISIINAIVRKVNGGKEAPPTPAARRDAPARQQQPGQAFDSGDSIMRERHPAAPAPAEDERVRKFLEALGLPAEAEPPKPVRPAVARPARPIPVSTPPPLPFDLEDAERRSAAAQRRADSAPSPYAVAKAKHDQVQSLTQAEREAMARIERDGAPKSRRGAYAIPQKHQSESDIAIRHLLAGPLGLRKAFILREILGPPAGLKPDPWPHSL